MDVSRWVAYQASWRPEKTALRFEGRALTYAELEERVARTAAWLQSQQVRRGMRVAYLGPNCPELLELFFACARVGVIFVPLNARMPASELGVFVELARPTVLVAEDGLHETAVATALTLGPDRVVTFSIGGGELLAPDAMQADPESDPNAPVLIAFTSGTTGTPKGAVHTNAGIIANAVDAVTALGIGPTDKILTVLPMFHVAGLNILTVPALSVGATVMLHRSFDPQVVLEDTERQGITLFLATPPIARALPAHPHWPTTKLDSLRALLVGGTVITDDTVRPWRERSVPVAQGYGMTEVGPVACLVPLADVPAKTLTAGKPTLHTQVRIVDPLGNDVTAHEAGEVIVRSPTVTLGYWQNPEATREAIPDGWLRTGDLGYLDDEGFLRIVDRIKELIIVGTSNVYPADVEAVLVGSPAIADAAVVGVPDEALGEVPVAFVVSEPASTVDREAVLQLFEGRLAPYKHPRHVFFVDALPRTPVGKVEKKTLRAVAASRLLTEANAGRRMPERV